MIWTSFLGITEVPLSARDVRHYICFENHTRIRPTSTWPNSWLLILLASRLFCAHTRSDAYPPDLILALYSLPLALHPDAFRRKTLGPRSAGYFIVRKKLQVIDDPSRQK